jgi:FixJ family two-component response regulator
MSVIVAVVDGDDAVLDSVSLVLELHGWQVWTYSSGESFLDVLGCRQPDCVVLDPHLPSLSGADVARAVSRVGGHVPIIALTARPTSKLTADVVQAGVAALLTKPVSEETLVRSIQDAVNK